MTKLTTLCVMALFIVGVLGVIAGDVTVQQAQRMLRSKQSKVVLLDVRTPQEQAQGVIPNAVLFHYGAPGFAEAIKALPRNGSYIVYCRSGRRSKETEQMMKSWNFTSVQNLLGGIDEWKRGNRVVTPK
jgi:rhodanese-related sulfurtransferase